MGKSKASAEGDVVTIKKYANRRLYDTERSCYITLDDLGIMVRDGREFRVVEAKTGDDITHNVLTQIIMETETRGETALCQTPASKAGAFLPSGRPSTAAKTPA